MVRDVRTESEVYSFLQEIGVLIAVVAEYLEKSDLGIQHESAVKQPEYFAY